MSLVKTTWYVRIWQFQRIIVHHTYNYMPLLYYIKGMFARAAILHISDIYI